jgi:WD40 repeat protein
VDDVAFSPDGKSVAIKSSSFGDTLQLFDIDSGSARWKHSGHGFGFTEVSFSADGSLLAVAADVVRVLDAADGHVVMRAGVASGGNVEARAVISPDGTRLAAVSGWRVFVYDVRSGAKTLSFRDNMPCHGVRYSPDGTRIATLGKDGIHVWDAASGQLQAALRTPATTNQMEFGGCRHVLVTAASDDSVIRVWDLACGTETRQLDTDTNWLTLGDGSGRVALTGGTDGTLRVWDVTTGQERTRLPTPLRFGLGLLNSDATKLATSNGKKSVEISSLAGGHGQQPAPDAAAPDDWCHWCGLMR